VQVSAKEQGQASACHAATAHSVDTWYCLVEIMKQRCQQPVNCKSHGVLWKAAPLAHAVASPRANHASVRQPCPQPSWACQLPTSQRAAAATQTSAARARQ